MSAQKMFYDLGFTQTIEKEKILLYKKIIVDSDLEIFLDAYIVFSLPYGEYQCYIKGKNEIKPMLIKLSLHNAINEMIKELTK
jgi:hypothetical protein